MIADTDIERFLHAQENVYSTVIKELKQGKKRTHWMWFIFPQITGLGFSETATYYSIKSVKEVKEFMMNEVLSSRLEECCSILLSVKNKTANEILGYPDDVKLLSSLTLFNFFYPGVKIYDGLINKYFAGEKDTKTLNILQLMINKH